MQKCLTIILTFILLSCGQNKTNDTEDKHNIIVQNTDSLSNEPNNTELNKDTTDWINSFKDFRNAIYQGDKLKVKTFIDFPIYNENNEIWYLANDGVDKFSGIPNDKVKPFPETEFDKHYNKIFPQTFINSILKIRTNILISEGKYETIELKDKETVYKTYATYDNRTSTLILSLAYVTPIKVNDGEKDIIENSEYNMIYYFKIINNKILKFKQIRIAG